MSTERFFTAAEEAGVLLLRLGRVRAEVRNAPPEIRDRMLAARTDDELLAATPPGVLEDLVAANERCEALLAADEEGRELPAAEALRTFNRFH